MEAAENGIDGACRICDAAGPHPDFDAREMMFGTRAPFRYFECGACGSVQIVAVPGDLGRFYPDDYYAFRGESRNPLSAWLLRQRTRHALGRFTVAGGLMSWYRRDDAMQAVGLARPACDWRILDVGCGRGKLLDRLAVAGFSRLSGIDPFLPADHQTPHGVIVRRQPLEEADGAFDLIMFHHALEHVIDPVRLLAQAEARLAPDGSCLVRIPTPSSEAWQTYGADWVQLDAPRHLVLPSRAGLGIAARKAGLQIETIIDDSTEFQFVGSALYARDIPLNGPGAGGSPIGRRQLAAFRRRARALNRAGRGDQIAVILRKIGSR